MDYLQSIGKDLVHLGNASRDGEIDGAVTDLDDEAALDVGVDLVVNLELLALADVLGLLNSGLEASEGLVVEWLGSALVICAWSLCSACVIEGPGFCLN